MKYAWTDKIIGTGTSIADPRRPLLFDIIKNTPKSVVYDKLLTEAIVILPDTIDAEDEVAINSKTMAEPASYKWKTRDEVNTWLSEKLGIGVDRLEKTMSTVTPFRSQHEAIGKTITFRGYGLREAVDVRGLRFFATLEKVE